MENKQYATALSGAYTAALASAHGLATNYHATTHPSLPNYLALTSGSTWDITDDGYHRLPPGGIGAQLSAAGISWRAYMEGVGANCLYNAYPYALKHDPFAYFGGSCTGVAPLDSLAADLAGNTPRFVWITPGLCHDTHDCSVATGDHWLSQVVPEIMASRAWSAGGVIFLTWDEDDGSSDNHVATLVIAAGVGDRRSAQPYNHYSLLASVEDLLGVGRLGAAQQAAAMNDLLGRSD